MKTDIETLRDSFWLGYDEFLESREEAEVAWNFYHNRQWNVDAINKLVNRGQPVETFNIVKLFSRMLVGYYSTTVNTAVADPVQYADLTTASLVTDSISHLFDINHMGVQGDKIKLSGMISGLMCTRQQPYKTGERDQFGRPLYSIKINSIPDYELILDPLSTEEDYSDARFLHRFKWLPEESVVKMFGRSKLKLLEANNNDLNIPEADYDYTGLGHRGFYGRYRVFDNYLVTHTVIEDDAGKRWSIYWSNQVELERKEITYKDVKWDYRVVKLQSSTYKEYYGIFHEVLETQKAINQALIKLQLMANSQKVFVEYNSVKDVAKFTDAVNRVNGVIPVKSLKGIKVENLTADAIEQYQIIDKAFDRIQRVLNINDSFLGMAFASDSGRKVKLQQNATIMALRYLTVRIEHFYQLLGQDIAALVKQYFTADQVLRVADDIVGQRFVQLNKPLEKWSGQIDPQTGQAIMEPIFEQIFDPEDNKPMINDDGKLVFAPVPDPESELLYSKHDIRIEAVNYNDEDERTQLMLETVMSGQMGQMMAQVNPAGFFKISSLTLKTMKTKYSPEIARIFEETAQMLQGNPEDEEAAALLAHGTSGANPSGGDDSKNMSAQNKLPTNTNEAPA